MTLLRSHLLLAVPAAALAMVAGGSAFVNDAAAHAKLVGAEPAPGSTVKVTPKAVRAWFNEELDVRRSAIGVWDVRGRRVDDGKGGVDLNDLDRRTLIARLTPLRPGVYVVKWKAVSTDDLYAAHGEFRFTVAR